MGKKAYSSEAGASLHLIAHSQLPETATLCQDSAWTAALTVLRCGSGGHHTPLHTLTRSPSEAEGDHGAWSSSLRRLDGSNGRSVVSSDICLPNTPSKTHLLGLPKWRQRVLNPSTVCASALVTPGVLALVGVIRGVSDLGTTQEPSPGGPGLWCVEACRQHVDFGVHFVCYWQGIRGC